VSLRTPRLYRSLARQKQTQKSVRGGPSAIFSKGQSPRHRWRHFASADPSIALFVVFLPRHVSSLTWSTLRRRLVAISMRRASHGSQRPSCTSRDSTGMRVSIRLVPVTSKKSFDLRTRGNLRWQLDVISTSGCSMPWRTPEAQAQSWMCAGGSGRLAGEISKHRVTSYTPGNMTSDGRSNGSGWRRS